MSSRRSVRQLLVAVLLGVLVGGGLMAVTPAGAEVSQAVATNWKKIWKKKLRPLADRRYYTKAQSDTKYATKVESDAKYQPKGAYETAGSGYSKAESDAKYTAAGSAYSKAEADAKFTPKATVIRGYFNLLGNVPDGGYLGDGISYGVNLTAVPTAHVIAPGAPAPVGCSGTVTAPGALPGNLCIFQRYSNATSFSVFGGASTFGAWINATRTTAALLEVSGTWALGVSSTSTARVSPSGDATSKGITGPQ